MTQWSTKKKTFKMDFAFKNKKSHQHFEISNSHSYEIINLEAIRLALIFAAISYGREGFLWTAGLQ